MSDDQLSEARGLANGIALSLLLWLLLAWWLL